MNPRIDILKNILMIPRIDKWHENAFNERKTQKYGTYAPKSNESTNRYILNADKSLPIINESTNRYLRNH